jgi:hypothetical protein
MAITTSDKRVVRVEVSQEELTALLSAQANAAGIIDFAPDRVDMINNGDGWEVLFEKDTPVTP